jgi:hypothetical protein
LHAKLVQQAAERNALLPELTPQRAIAHFKERRNGGKRGRVGNIRKQKCTNLASYSDSRFQIVEQVVAKSHDRWEGGLIAEICSLVQPSRPKDDLVGLACKDCITSDLVRGQAKFMGFRIGQSDPIRSERGAHDVPHQRYVNTDLHFGEEAVDLRIGCGAGIGLDDPTRELLLFVEFDGCQRRRKGVIQFGKGHRLAKVGAAKNGEPVHAVSGDVNRCADAVWQMRIAG